MLEGWYVLIIFAASLAILSTAGTALPLGILFNGRFRSVQYRLSSRTWFFVGCAPVVLGLFTAVAAFSSAVLKEWMLISDHCEVHPGHPHLCWAHAQVDPWQGGILGGLVLLALSFAVYRLGRLVHSVSKSNREIRTASGRSKMDGFALFPSRIPAAMVAGLVRPRAYLTTAAFELLTSRERWIVSQHEAEHLRGRDPLRLLILRLGAALFPGFRKIEQAWLIAREFECDSACLAAGASPEEVSSTILKLARLGGAKVPASALSYTPETPAMLRYRVETLLSNWNPIRGRWRGRWVWWVLFVGVLGVLFAGHHGLETVLGVVIN